MKARSLVGAEQAARACRLLKVSRAACYQRRDVSCGERVARLMRAAGLEGYGRPKAYVARQIDRWTRQYVAANVGDVPDMDRLMAWLPARVPAEDETAIAHGAPAMPDGAKWPVMAIAREAFEVRMKRPNHQYVPRSPRAGTAPSSAKPSFLSEASTRTRSSGAAV